MIRRVSAISDAVIRDMRPVTLPDGTTGRLAGHFIGPDGHVLALVSDSRHFFTDAMSADTEVEIGAAT